MVVKHGNKKLGKNIGGKEGNNGFRGKTPLEDSPLTNKTNINKVSGIVGNFSMILLAPFEENKDYILSCLNSKDYDTRSVGLDLLRKYLRDSSKETFEKAYSILYNKLSMIINMKDFKSLSYLVLSNEHYSKYEFNKKERDYYVKASKLALVGITNVIKNMNGEDAFKAVYRLANIVPKAPPIIKTEALRSIRDIISNHQDSRVRGVMLIELGKIVKFFNEPSRRRALEYMLRIANEKRLDESKNARVALVHIFDFEDVKRNRVILNDLISIYESNQASLQNLHDICEDILKEITKSRYANNEIKNMAKEALKRNTSFIKRVLWVVGSALSPLVPKFIDYIFKTLREKEIWTFLKNILIRYLPRI